MMGTAGEFGRRENHDLRREIAGGAMEVVICSL